ncbi:unnamed protein product [Medioppia subpectinata]|uniref:Regulator of telomere elongation helicase 1 homolog n=1 Tax=Medioppia subpectinata TaxID=1979941 RepID=A0A7R9PUC8_9ACAR|nr:unnamed protein product [Medioppia subpectinata]CAG2101396.1 unnamed protein product [Medioppia subpectinata]
MVTCGFNRMFIVSFRCMSPSVGGKELMAEGVHSMIITSGTLAPIHSFELEMDMKFEIKLQNNHIIGDNQLSIVTIGESKDNVMLSSNYRNREKEDYVRALGQTLVDVFKATPKGILVFFPSYQVLNRCTKLWTQLRVWEDLNRVKRVFLEPQNKLEFNKAFERYKQTVDDGFSNGAAFLGVFRGKLSEGIDLPDDYCRAVVMTGLPYPAVFDPRVMLKKKYLTEAQIGLTPHEWYALQMKRALNQAIGRVVRHKDDYGVIVLLDSRFASLSDGLSKWIERFIKKHSKDLYLNQTYAKIRLFFHRFNTSNKNMNEIKNIIDNKKIVLY